MLAFARLSKAFAIAAVALAVPVGAMAQGAAGPARVVSMNLCTDQLAMMLAAPGQLISVSAIASDPLVSPMAEEAQGYGQNFGGAEEIFLLDPDLVVAGIWSDPAVISMLRRLGIAVVQFDLVDGLEDVPARLLEMGAALGREAEAEALAEAYREDLAAIRTPADGPRAAFYYPNGYTLGASGLSHDILTTAGFRHIAEETGRSFAGQLALELLVTAAPELIIGSTPYPGASRSEEILRHPALRALVAAGEGTVSGPEWVCGTPHVLRALRALQELRLAMEAAP